MRKNSIVNALGCLTALFLLSGCLGSNTQNIEISAKPIDKPALELPNADGLRMRNIEWVIVTPENYQEVFEKLGQQGRPIALFALTDKGYENLGLNLSDLRAYIQQQQAIIVAYENYYKRSGDAIDAANEQIGQTANQQPRRFNLNPFN